MCIKVLHQQSGCYGCIWQTVIQVHRPAMLDAITDVAANWGADVYFYVHVSQREQVKQFIRVLNVCVCVWSTPADLTFTPDLAAPSPRLSQREQMARTYPTKKPSNTHTHSQTWCATQEPPWHPLTCLSVQQWVMLSILSHQVSVWMWPAVCIDKSPEVSKSNHSACCSFLVTHSTVPALLSKQEPCSDYSFIHVI